MTIKVGEIGKSLYVGTTFDMNAAPFTVITLRFTSPDGLTGFTRDSTSDGITAPAVASPALVGTGILPANTYALYLTQATDFAVSGNWSVCLQYEDAAPSLFSGDDAVLTIEEACD